ncbi:uncharacterized protein LOC127449812 [Myxocyprinus asiaticus]|uniref:uncharacterized protein LOC127449812 n=1 Tax=Myxocyprinus asiaticus TaxID=70543 RepID=UPI002222AA68|nr:uncharacterized protein LOC127449812 [Myxocyprinus asiaticus]
MPESASDRREAPESAADCQEAPKSAADHQESAAILPATLKWRRKRQVLAPLFTGSKFIAASQKGPESAVAPKEASVFVAAFQKGPQSATVPQEVPVFTAAPQEGSEIAAASQSLLQWPPTSYPSPQQSARTASNTSQPARTPLQPFSNAMSVCLTTTRWRISVEVTSTLTMFPNSEGWFFQQDKAPCHTARSIKVWMEDHRIKILSWPAQSPDLNPFIWVKTSESTCASPPSKDTDKAPPTIALKYLVIVSLIIFLLYSNTSTSRITHAFKHISVICYRPITRYRCKTKCNPHNLRPLCTSAPAPLSFSVGLWNCQSAVNKADFIPAFATQSTLSILALTETWIRPEDTATPAALSNNFSFSHTPRHTGQLTNFLEELDVLLSSLPEDGRTLVVLGDFNIHQDKPQATELNTLLASFDLEKLHTTATQRSGNQLDLIFTRQHVLHHPAPGYLTSFVNIGLTLGQLRGDGGNLKIQQI